MIKHQSTVISNNGDDENDSLIIGVLGGENMSQPDQM